MSRDIENHIKTFERCLRFKGQPHKAELHPILATHPIELIHLDYLTNESGKSNTYVNSLVFTDLHQVHTNIYYSFGNCKCILDQILWDKYFIHCGLPKKILRDQGHNFKSSLILELGELSKIKKNCTRSY